MKKLYGFILVLLGVSLLFTGCGDGKDTEQTAEQTKAEQTVTEDTGIKNQVASADEMVSPAEVVEEGMVPVYGQEIRDGVYSVTVDSSSSMFNIVSCELTVQDGKMSAVMTMSGTGYQSLYMGTGEEAAAASEDLYIPYVELESGEHTFEVPVEALDMGISCTAFSKKKEKWYDRVLVFRADSLPQEAFVESKSITVESLGLEDGEYTVEAVLEGGSGKASIESPARLRIAEGKAYLTVVFGSPNYDYMVVEGERYEPVNAEGNSTFEIPVACFDWKLPVKADTIAMSTPHEIDYTIYLDSASVVKAE